MLLSTENEYSTQQKVAIVTRLREHLLLQRERFQAYLELLDEQEKSIDEQNMDKLQFHVELEQSIVKEIYALQRVIDPLRDMYAQAYPEREAEIPALEASLERVRVRVLEQNERNRTLLRDRMDGLRMELKGLRAKAHARSLYQQAMPSLVDVMG